MRTDRELLELAAKAAGISIYFSDDGSCYHAEMAGNASFRYRAPWNPLAYDGDALRLSVKLRISLIHEEERFSGGHVIETIEATGPRKDDFSRHCEMFSLNEEGDDPMRNTRRAIVLAAAEIGAGMP